MISTLAFNLDNFTHWRCSIYWGYIYSIFGQWKPLPRVGISELFSSTLGEQAHIAGIRGVAITPNILYQWPPHFDGDQNHLQNLVENIKARPFPASISLGLYARLAFQGILILSFSSNDAIIQKVLRLLICGECRWPRDQRGYTGLYNFFSIWEQRRQQWLPGLRSWLLTARVALEKEKGSSVQLTTNYGII